MVARSNQSALPKEQAGHGTGKARAGGTWQKVQEGYCTCLHAKLEGRKCSVLTQECGGGQEGRKKAVGWCVNGGVGGAGRHGKCASRPCPPSSKNANGNGGKTSSLSVASCQATVAKKPARPMSRHGRNKNVNVKCCCMSQPHVKQT